MWLPAPIYERLPQIWLIIGLMILGFALYLGFDYDLIYVYLGLGALCIAYSAWLFRSRRKFRDDESQPGGKRDTQDSDKSAAH